SVAGNLGFWRFAAANMATAARELPGVVSIDRFVDTAAHYVPKLAGAGGRRATRGIRAQAMNRDGTLVDDFVIDRAGATMFVRNASSPEPASALASAEHLVDTVEAEVRGLRPRKSEGVARTRERPASVVLATKEPARALSSQRLTSSAAGLLSGGDSLGNASLGADEPGLLLELGDVVVEDVGGRRIRGIDLVVAAAHRGDGRLDRLDHVVDGVV